MQIWDFFNALLRFASPSLCSTSASSAEFPRSTSGRLLPKGRKNSAEKKIGNLTFEPRSLTTEGTQEFPPLKKSYAKPKGLDVERGNSAEQGGNKRP